MCCYRILKTSFAYRSCNDTSHSFATLFFEFDVILSPPFSIATTTLQVFSDHLSSSQFLQLFSTAAAANSSQSCSISPPSPQLFSLLLCFSQLFPTTLASSSPFSSFLDSFQFFFNSPAASLTSSHLFRSPSELFSPPVRNNVNPKGDARSLGLVHFFKPVEVTQLQSFLLS